MPNYCLYQRLIRQYSTDGGSTWLPVSPLETQLGSLLESESSQCGVGATTTRWTTYLTETVQSGLCSYYVQHQEESVDGVNWYTTSTTQRGPLASCSYDGKRAAYLVGSTVRTTDCAAEGERHYITSAETRINADYSGATELYLGGCDDMDYVVYENALQGFRGLETLTIGPSVAQFTTFSSQTLMLDKNRSYATVDANNLHFDSRDNCNAVIDSSTDELVVGTLHTVIPNSVKRIGNGAFAGLSGMTTMTIPSSVESIGQYAFSACYSLYTIRIPDGVKTIERSAFDSNTGATAATIGSSVESIGPYAFNNCRALDEIRIKAETPPTITATSFNQTNNCHIYVPSISLEDYKSAWPTLADRIEADIS